MKKHILPVFFMFLLLTGCGGKDFQKSPVDELAKEMTNLSDFTIILYDMDTEGSFFKTYKHQYRVIKEETEGEPTEEVTDWYEVSDDFFNLHLNDMGMEIASKTNGKLSKAVSPPGYSNYVGNAQYGQWRTGNDGSSFWEFYGKFAFMSSMFNMFTYPVRRSYWDDYRGNYYGRGRAYYGPTTAGGGRYYGTNSEYNRQSRSSSRWTTNSNNNSFKRRVNQRTSRSSRSSSRSSRSSYRSRGGRSGK